MKFTVKSAAVVALCLGASAARAEKITCNFSYDMDDGRQIATTIIGDNNFDPEWIAQTIIVPSAKTTKLSGEWAGAAAENPDFRVSEIKVFLGEWNGEAASGFSLLAAPVISGTDAAGMDDGADAYPARAVWGIFKINGRPVLSGPMPLRDYGVGMFPEIFVGYMNRPGDDVPFGASDEVTQLLEDLAGAFSSVTLEIYPIKSDASTPPEGGTDALALFEYDAVRAKNGVAQARALVRNRISAFKRGCPYDRADPPAENE